MIDFDLKNKTAIVTGASGNLGPIWVEALEDLGARVVDFDLPEQDVTDFTQAQSFMLDHPPDILINNAGIDNPPGTDASHWNNWDEIMSVNLAGVKNMVKAAIPHMVTKGRGHIINIGSMYGLISPDPAMYADDFQKPMAYGSGKAALINLTQQVAVNYGQYGIQCNCLTLGVVHSDSQPQEFIDKMLPRIPLRRRANKRDLKRALWSILVSDYATGANFIHDGGYTCL